MKGFNNIQGVVIFFTKGFAEASRISRVNYTSCDITACFTSVVSHDLYTTDVTVP